MRFMDKQEFIERYIDDQEQKKQTKKGKKKKSKRTTTLPFKESTYLDIVNLFREELGEDAEIEKPNEILLNYKGKRFSIKIISKRQRVS